MKTLRPAPGVTRNALFWLSSFLLAALMGLAAPAAHADTVLPDTIGVGGSPRRLAVTPDGKAVYVVNNTGGSVSVIDADPASPHFNTLIIFSIYVGYALDSIAITPSGYAYVVMQGGLVKVIDTNRASPAYNTIIAEITITALGTIYAAEVAITPDGKRAYVTNHTAHTMSVIDTDPASPTWNTIIATITDAEGLSPNPYGLAIAPNGLAYVADYFTPTISVIDTNPASPAYNTVVRSYADPSGLGHGSSQVATSPDGRYVYVGTWAANSVSVIDTVAGTSSRVDIGSASVGLAVTEDGKYVYVAAYSTNSVQVVDTGSNTVIDTLPVGRGTYGVTINKCYVYAANSVDNTVSVIERSGNCSGGGGGIGGGGAAPIPALHETALTLLALLLAGGAAAALRRGR